MECLVCHQKIKSGEHVFWGSQMICDGPEHMDFHYFPASDNSMGVMHLSCLESPAAAATTPNGTVLEQVEEQLAVTRSDALAIFDGIGK